MMNEYKTKVICPVCGKEEEITIQTLIDSTRIASVERDVLSGKVFSHTCSFCHEEYPVSYSCRYHDGKRKLLVFMADNEKDLIEMRNRVNGKYSNDRLEQTLNNWLDNCTVRIVTSEYELQEKILIAHFGLDDKVVELARSIVGKQLREQQNDSKDILFNRSEDGFAFLIVTENGITGSIPFSDDMYESLKNRFPNLKDDNCYEIDRLWAENFLSLNNGIS